MLVRMMWRQCFREPIPEIEEVAYLMAGAVAAHMDGDRDAACNLFRRADNRSVWLWTDSIWGKNSPHTCFRKIVEAPAYLPQQQRAAPRMPSTATRNAIHGRDGHYCRFCKIPVVRAEVRRSMAAEYPDAVPWGRTNDLAHAGFQCLWAQYDHIVPHARGGFSTLESMVLTCAACNYGRGS